MPDGALIYKDNRDEEMRNNDIQIRFINKTFQNMF